MNDRGDIVKASSEEELIDFVINTPNATQLGFEFLLTFLKFFEGIVFEMDNNMEGTILGYKVYYNDSDPTVDFSTPTIRAIDSAIHILSWD